MRKSKLMKIGEERTFIDLWLGKLKVATIYHCISYGVSYIPQLKQHRSEDVYLSYFDRCEEDRELKFKSMDSARDRLQDMCGSANFSRLTETKKYKNTVEEKEVQPALWGPIDP